MTFACSAARRPRPGVDDVERTEAPDWKSDLIVDNLYWGPGPARLSVAFLDLSPGEERLRSRVLGHMNRWSEHAAVEFYLEPDPTKAKVRVARRPGKGMWAAIGREIDHVPVGEPTMNLEGVTDDTTDAELQRVVVHEAGHSLGMQHEHLRAEVVKNLDPQVVRIWFGVRTGWSPERINREILTPVAKGSLYDSSAFDSRSVMCYFIPGIASLDGKEIPGGKWIDAIDAAFIAKVYPR